MQDAGRVIFGVTPRESRVGQNRGAQFVVRVQIGTAHAFVDHLLKRRRRVLQPAIHPPFDEDIDDARVLTNGSMALCAHPAVGQNLGDCILRRR